MRLFRKVRKFMDDVAKIAALADSINAAAAIIITLNPPVITPPAPLDFTPVDTAMTALNAAIADLQTRLA